ncbi:MAG: phage protein Gp27 family protein [Burkholderiaceae bacterium]
MAPRSAVALLPKEVIDQLNVRLVDQAFSDYDGLATWLQEQGYQVSKTAVWRHGSSLQQSMEKSLSRARERMEIAKALRGASDDEKAALMEANEMVAMDQIMDMFEEVAGLEIGDRMAAIPKLVRAIADLNRSAIGSSKWKREFEAEIRRQEREDAANRISEVAKAQGLDVEQAKFWREKVLMGV